MNVVRELASPRYEGRATASRGGALARGFVEREFRRIGLAPAADAGFLQWFSAPPAEPSSRPAGSIPRAANVVGYLAGARPEARLIVVSAHYDHLGTVEGTLYPGADDNASGVAVLLAAAAWFAERPPRHGMMFVAFDAEEFEGLGAAAFVSRPPVPLGRIALNVNLDMVGRGDRGEVFAAGTSHTPELRAILEPVRRRAAVRLVFGHDTAGESGPDDWTRSSDHGAFHAAGVPFVYFGVEDHRDYHRPTDTPDRIDLEFFGNVADLVIDALTELDRSGLTAPAGR